LSRDEWYDNFGTIKKLYQDYCPMYDQGKVGMDKRIKIKNPYQKCWLVEEW
jgi:hypothetical protein